LKDKYDFYIIAGDWAMSGAVKNKPNLWYVHSPIREIWDLYEDTRKRVPFPFGFIFDFWVYFNRYFNKRYFNHVDKLVCNSENTKKRVETFFKKSPKVINPPIETKKFKYRKSKGYWLSVNRLIDHKRVHMQIEAFRKLPKEKLIIVGSYEKSRHFLKYANRCLKNKPENVEILSWVSDEELIDLYSSCKGFITTSKDEDFGMSIIEAMACGKPVIAPKEGGYKESVLDGKTGFLIDKIDSEKLRKTILKTNSILKKNPGCFKKNSLKRAKDFDTSVFIKKIKEALNEKA
jgi:glycosyltransferase involved in cell wall biosynthesis